MDRNGAEAKSDDGTFISPLSICLALLLTVLRMYVSKGGTSREQIFLQLVEVKSLGLKEMNVEVQQFIRSVARILSTAQHSLFQYLILNRLWDLILLFPYLAQVAFAQNGYHP